MATTTLDLIKGELRVSGTAFDMEIQGLIDACKSDLEQSGVVNIAETDHLIKTAITTYCKGMFGWDNPESDRFLACYAGMRDKLALASDYNAFKVTFTVKHLLAAVKDATITIDDDNATELTTNSLGVAVYYTYDKLVDVDYTVSCAGYSTVTGSVYVDSDESVAVAI